MEFRVLGPLEVSAAGEPLPLGGPKQRAILALLLLSANEVVPRERLIDDVWGEEPPPEVDASLRVYIARLRKIFAAGNGSGPTLETYRNGYVLRIAPETLDLTRFEGLLASGTKALAAGRPEVASAELSEALGLWRGPALVDLAHEPWVQRESARLEGLRHRALEERIESDLTGGRHAELISELEALVAADPYHERFVRQLMVALYRCGRQSDALQVYAHARDRLRETYGLEPTRALKELERRILVQDRALELPDAPEVASSASRPRRRPRRALAVALAALVVVLVTALLAVTRDPAAPAPESVELRGNSVVAIDPRTNSVAGEIRLTGRPSGIAVGLGSVWVGNREEKTLLRIDPDTRGVVRTIGLGVEPWVITLGGGSVWVLSQAADAVLEVDPVTSDVVATIPLRTERQLGAAFNVEFARGAVWVSSWHAVVLRIDPSTHDVETRFRDVYAIASTGNALWGLGGIQADRIQRLDPPGEPIRLDRVGAIRGLIGIAVDDRALWTSSYEGTLWRIDPDTGRVTFSVRMGEGLVIAPPRGIAGLALTGQDAWVVTKDAHVVRVDADTGRVMKTIPLGVFSPTISGAIAAGEGGVWVAALPR